MKGKIQFIKQTKQKYNDKTKQVFDDYKNSVLILYKTLFFRKNTYVTSLAFIVLLHGQLLLFSVTIYE